MDDNKKFSGKLGEMDMKPDKIMIETSDMIWPGRVQLCHHMMYMYPFHVFIV